MEKLENIKIAAQECRDVLSGVRTIGILKRLLDNGIFKRNKITVEFADGFIEGEEIDFEILDPATVIHGFHIDCYVAKNGVAIDEPMFFDDQSFYFDVWDWVDSENGEQAITSTTLDNIDDDYIEYLKWKKGEK